MAEIQESGNKKKGGKNKQKKMTVRVDFTPMVDMNMLLITFFMLCTSLSKPQTMEISMPSNDKNVTEEQQSKVKASQAITLLLGGDDKLYYYDGEPNYKDYSSLKEITYIEHDEHRVSQSQFGVRLLASRELHCEVLRAKYSAELLCREEFFLRGLFLFGRCDHQELRVVFRDDVVLDAVLERVFEDRFHLALTLLRHVIHAVEDVLHVDLLDVGHLHVVERGAALVG